jgi:hypothetical protein
MNKLGCPLCDCDLVILSESDPEYYRSLAIKDGNMKWFKCTGDNCKCVFVKDKQKGTWSYSPDTYTRLLKQEVIEDKLA